MKGRYLSLVVALGLTAFAGRARAADGAGDPARAKQLADAAHARVAAGDCNHAIADLVESARTAESVDADLDLARCYDGDALASWTYFKRAEHLAAKSNDPRASSARSAALALAPRLATFTLAFKPQRPASFELHVDGESIAVLDEDPIAVSPEVHKLEIWVGGDKPWTQSITPVRGTVLPVDVTRVDDPVAHPSTVGDTQRKIGLLTGAVGIFGLGLGVAFTLIAKDYRGSAGNEAKPADAADDSANADSATTLSIVSFVAGGALLAGGVVLYLVAPRGDAPSAYLAPRVGSTSGLVLGGTW